MKRPQIILDTLVWSLSAAFLGVFVAAQSHAAPPAAAETWRTECGGCHIAYPPQLLSAPEWSTVLDRLDRHFGVDASLAPAELARVRAYLAPRIEPAARVDGQALPRITTSSWFRHEHDEVAPAAWRRPAIGRASNCAACHAGAERGDFDEDGVRIPR